MTEKGYSHTELALLASIDLAEYFIVKYHESATEQALTMQEQTKALAVSRLKDEFGYNDERIRQGIIDMREDVVKFAETLGK